jgi:hypothetical protein
VLRGSLVLFLGCLVHIGAVLQGLGHLVVPLLEMVLVLLVFGGVAVPLEESSVAVFLTAINGEMLGSPDRAVRFCVARVRTGVAIQSSSWSSSLARAVY